jgi:hypothetical protein
MQIFAALESAAIQLLHNSVWKKIDKKHAQVCADLKIKFKPENNYRSYRDMIGALSDSSCVPFLGPLMSDITFVSVRLVARLQSFFFFF